MGGSLERVMRLALTDTLKAVSDPVRREILQMLKEREMNAGEIAARFSITDAAISRHLSVLKKADLIRSHRHGQFIRYELNASVLDELILWAAGLQTETRKGEKRNAEIESESAESR